MDDLSLFYQQDQIQRIRSQDFKYSVRPRPDGIFETDADPFFRIIQSRLNRDHRAGKQAIFLSGCSPRHGKLVDVQT